MSFLCTHPKGALIAAITVSKAHCAVAVSFVTKLTPAAGQTVQQQYRVFTWTNIDGGLPHTPNSAAKKSSKI